MSALFAKANTLLDTVVPQYLNACQQAIGENSVGEAVKGNFPNIHYTTDGYDPSDLSHEEKLNLIKVLYSKDVAISGEPQARERLESQFKSVKERLGAEKSFEDLVQHLPEGVFEEEKLANLSKEELTEKLKTCFSALDKLKTTPIPKPTTGDQKLEEKIDILETILYNTGDGVYTLDPNSVITTFNKTMEELTGYSTEEAVGKTADEVVNLHDDSSPIDSNRYNPKVNPGEGQKVYSNNKVTLEARDGVKKSVKIMSSTIPNTDKGSVGCIVTLSDMSKETQLETMKLDFVSIAAHELRTPLTSIRGYLDLLNRELDGKIEGSQKDYLQKVSVASDQLYILVENLLNISRIERGNLILQKNTEDWVAIVNSVIGNFEGVAKEAKVSINLMAPATPIPPVSVDKVMISEVLSNLIDNAIKYNKPEGRISIILEPLDTEIITHVKDTGVGIPEESTPHLFKKFYRTSTSVWRQGKKGTGLGLFISHEIVKLHGGRIWFDSKEGEGSTFSFTVPAVAQSPQQ